MHNVSFKKKRKEIEQSYGEYNLHVSNHPGRGLQALHRRTAPSCSQSHHQLLTGRVWPAVVYGHCKSEAGELTVIHPNLSMFS